MSMEATRRHQVPQLYFYAAGLFSSMYSDMVLQQVNTTLNCVKKTSLI